MKYKYDTNWFYGSWSCEYKFPQKIYVEGLEIVYLKFSTKDRSFFEIWNVDIMQFTFVGAGLLNTTFDNKFMRKG